MALMEFVEILATQLIHNNLRNLDISENDPDQYPKTAGKKDKHSKKKNRKNQILKNYHFDNKGEQHNLTKSGIRVTKHGKKYNKTNDCVVCKKENVCRQTTFICSICEVPLCAPVLTERTQAPRDCFRKYHENIFVNADFSDGSSDDSDSIASNDEWFQKKPKAKKRKCDHQYQFAQV